MVNNKNRTPHYDLDQIKAYVQQRQFDLVTSSARKDYKELGWTIEKFIAIVECLNVSCHFHKTHHQMTTDIGPITADAYRICFEEDALKEDRAHGIMFFLKLAIDPEQPGTAVVSFHLSRCL